jgi:hypothetical protein
MIYILQVKGNIAFFTYTCFLICYKKVSITQSFVVGYPVACTKSLV